MSGRFTRRMYDNCAFEQNVKQSTDPLEMVLDVMKYVHRNNVCHPVNETSISNGNYAPPSSNGRMNDNNQPKISPSYPTSEERNNVLPINNGQEMRRGSPTLVDIESSLLGIDKIYSKCDTHKHPLCGPHGCLLNSDPKIPPHVTPYVKEWGHSGDDAVVTTNMKIPSHVGYKLPDYNICKQNNDQINGKYPINGYYQSK